MERLNPQTNQPFKHGEKRSDGYRFYRYNRRRVKKDGTFSELWLSPEAFEKNVTSNSRQASSKAANQRIKQERSAMLAALKVERGCSVCGYNKHPAALDFDHRDPSEKSFNISQRLTIKLERLMDEVNKCDVLCACCHRIRTHEGKHYHAKTAA